MELAAEILPYGISCCAVYLGCKVGQARQDEKKRLSKAEKEILSLEQKIRANKMLIDKLNKNGDDMKFKIDLTGDTVRNTEDTLSKKFAHYDKMIHTCTTISTKTADVSRDRLRNMKERITKMQATMNEIISRANTPQVVEMEDDSSVVTQQSCLSGDSFILQKDDKLNRRCSRDEGELIHEIFASEGGDGRTRDIPLIPLPSGASQTFPVPLLTSTPLQRSKFLSSRIQLSKARRNEIIERLNKLRASE
ncbi:unnamed protein product [Oikopleura dioica]|uniref:Uncharacterized protein n=1 Tax=Oikopleura dioica TaxID=34765 RepID=E4YJI0_OIKDI|nr:unnamed protein product [Oikopleura dioica]